MDFWVINNVNNINIFAFLVYTQNDKIFEIYVKFNIKTFVIENVF